MNKFEKYHFDDFTLASYRKLIKIAKKNYAIRSYTNTQKNEKFLIIRHDIDYSMKNAAKLSEIEYEEGISTTYFILMHSEFYNLLEKENMEIIKRIISHGHNIGLHFDFTFYDINTEKDLVSYLYFEKIILAKIFDTEIHAFSFHNPTEESLVYDKNQYAGLINTYSKYFRTNVDYCSDSNGYWRFKRLEDVLQTTTNNGLQVLLHPVWWTSEPLSPRNKIIKNIKELAERNIEIYDRLLNELGRKNIR